MTKINCRVPGCPNSKVTNEVTNKNPVFICSGLGADGYRIKGHSRKEIVELLGRIYNTQEDEKDKKVVFSKSQFDPDLKQGGIYRRTLKGHQ
jgi:hypothetical protein